MSVFTNPASGASDSARAYIDATLGMLGDRDAIAVLQEGVAAFAGLLDRGSAEQLARPEAPGKWSAAALMQHMADSETIWTWRISMVQAHDRPTLAGYDQDAWADRLHYLEADPATALERFSILRRHNLSLLSGVAAEDWDRVSVHDERGEETLRHMSRLHAGHDLVHRRQMERIIETVS